MIILKKLKWNNLFSYARDNEIDFSKHKITQLLGLNGHGKTSLVLILEELLYSKNSKGVKKADILNRYVKDKSYSMSLEFQKDSDTYLVETTRGSTQTISLYKNGINISAHTATNTLKNLESILGIDHKAFTQLVYQSSGSSLEFLLATDTNRKKFLIDLLNLSKYVEAFEVFKALVKELDSEVSTITTKLKTTEAWFNKHSKESLQEIDMLGYPVYNDNPDEEIGSLRSSISSIDSTNKKIAKNLALKNELKAIPIEDITITPPSEEDISEELAEIGSQQRIIKEATVFISSNATKAIDVCPTCGHAIDSSKIKELIAQQEALKADAKKALSKLESAVLVKKSKNSERARLLSIKSAWETLHAQVDKDLPDTSINPEDLKEKLLVLESKVATRTKKLKEIEKHNAEASANNARVRLIKEQMKEMQDTMAVLSSSIVELNERLSIAQVLQKTFSTSGLIAYKIECMVKDLENLANEYLAELSAGRFQITFKIVASDKLNVIILDNGREIDINALSGGEKARVNTATLLAIRKLMQSLSSTKINLLILDETIDSLDLEGKEKLVEVLLKENSLNTILISHGYQHPLLEKVSVVKTDNISRIE